MSRTLKVFVSFMVSLMLVSATSVTASAGTSVNEMTPEWGIPVSWTNPSIKPPKDKVLKVKFKFTNSNSNIKYFNVLGTTLIDANGIEVADEISIGNINRGESGYVTLDIYERDLRGSKAPYTIEFKFNGISLEPYANVMEISDFPFAFEVPTTITCVKKGKPNKKVTKYKPVCPTGYKKK